MELSSWFTVRRAVLFLFAAAQCALAGEYAVLSTGFRIHAQSHVIDGDTVKLETAGGVIALPAASIRSFEVEEYTPPPAVLDAKPQAVSLPAPASSSDPKQLLSEAAARAGLPVGLVHSIAKAESGFRTDAVSPKGAIGLMQLMPGTAASLNVNPYDPQQNAEAGARYLADLLLKYQDDPHQVTKAIAAYNAGPGAVDKYHGVPPYPETINYVNRVVQQYLKSQETEP